MTFGGVFATFSNSRLAPADARASTLEATLRRISIPVVLITALSLSLASSFSTASLDAAESAFRVDPSKTRIGFARVHLDVSDLTLKGTELQGRYRIRVPMFPFKNDTGTIRLRTDGPIDLEREITGKLMGTANSDSGIARDILCTLGPDNSIDIGITLNTRVLTFKTKYQRL